MSLVHVYIVLEPVRSARLTFDDDRYYEFMYFDVPKVVRSPGCDHGHDEESQNGRDVKIDILDNYVWTPKRFRTFIGVPGVTGTPPGTNGPCWALVERERGRPGQEARPLPLSPNRTRKGGGAPLPFPSPTPSFPLLLGLGEGGANLLGVGFTLL